MTLKFQMLDGFKWIEVEFESESRERNILMEVIFEDYHLDTSSLHQHNKELYKQIKAAMKNNADSFWEDQEEKIKIPTLYYHILK